MRSIVSAANGGRPVFERGQCGSTIAISADHGTTRSMSWRNSRLRVFLVDRFNPRLACFMAPSRSAPTVRVHASGGPVLQTFPKP